MTYIITATITRKTGQGEITHQVPTFFLDGDIQGIINEEHAALIAKTIIDSFALEEHRVAVHAQKSALPEHFTEMESLLSITERFRPQMSKEENDEWARISAEVADMREGIEE